VLGSHVVHPVVPDFVQQHCQNRGIIQGKTPTANGWFIILQNTNKYTAFQKRPISFLILPAEYFLPDRLSVRLPSVRPFVTNLIYITQYFENE